MKYGKKGDQSTSKTPSKQYDRLFKKLLENKERTGVIVLEHLPPITQLLAHDSPKLLGGEYIDEALQYSQSDCLFKVRLRDGNPLLIYTFWLDRKAL